MRRGLGENEVTHETIMQELTSVADRVLPYRETIWLMLDEERRLLGAVSVDDVLDHLLDDWRDADDDVTDESWTRVDHA